MEGRGEGGCRPGAGKGGVLEHIGDHGSGDGPSTGRPGVQSGRRERTRTVIPGNGGAEAEAGGQALGILRRRVDAGEDWAPGTLGQRRVGGRRTVDLAPAARCRGQRGLGWPELQGTGAGRTPGALGTEGTVAHGLGWVGWAAPLEGGEGAGGTDRPRDLFLPPPPPPRNAHAVPTNTALAWDGMPHSLGTGHPWGQGLPCGTGEKLCLFPPVQRKPWGKRPRLVGKDAAAPVPAGTEGNGGRQPSHHCPTASQPHTSAAGLAVTPGIAPGCQASLLKSRGSPVRKEEVPGGEPALKRQVLVENQSEKQGRNKGKEQK